MALFSKRVLTGTRSKALQQSGLDSFLKQSIHKDPTSSVYLGTMFEMQTMEALQTIGMDLSHVGGKGDRGVDLSGEWPLALSSTFAVPRLIVQCKRLQKGCSPDHLRSLVGTVVNMAHPTQPTIGILATLGHRPFTKELSGHFLSSQVPLGLAMVDENCLKSLVFNLPAQEILQGVVVTTRYTAAGDRVPVVTFKGQVIDIENKMCI
ncbi:hypothetical protein J3Q64DRAFT_1708182 [Phycomyces blakesleeanus]|uniref:Required for respiratory growth protein 7, mitochondrial n=2 Tax=Phycomyces blakesleeanus TaxID=4837 RepID=A0A162URN5_PHYB8|nr:hypothetical protein PHYBLDRAFT_60484 [Phycomyces blakesleeanus NRRL 1555(-)]OAD77353.1 hypothetical protein PHYBLDRAFT_60484 [Phycomyces blakesleeanus NRRL 1555(-)]|eukprot:XP_018295393.1 hypothetical protein PHYBLDRAFT_60484 [Phycomyces blakesleeanus NRRL 1555(-)]